MSVPADMPTNDEIARVAHAIWEAEGRPDGRDHDHWMRARQLIEEGRAELEYPRTAPKDTPSHVESGSDGAGPGTVPVTRKEPEDDRGGAGVPDAKPVPERPEEPTGGAPTDVAMPGPRNPDPVPPTNSDGYVAVPSTEDVAGLALGDDPRPPAAKAPSRRRGSGTR